MSLKQVKKALKGTGGIIKLTLKGQALARWFLARPVRAKYSMQFHKSVCKSQIKSDKIGTYHPSDSKAADRSSLTKICNA